LMRKAAGIVGAVALAVVAFGATRLVTSGRWYRIPQNGMYPGLPSGSYLLVRPHPYELPSEVRRGDIVVFTRVEKGALYNYIWRVIGLPGDAMEVSGRKVAVNGVDLPRQAARDEGDFAIFRESNAGAVYEVAYPKVAVEREPPAASITVPAGCIFVLGDNRYNAVDSRYFGPVPFETVIGKKIWAP